MTNPISALIDAATAQAGTRQRGIADLCHIFNVRPYLLANWRDKGIPKSRQDLVDQVCTHYGVS